MAEYIRVKIWNMRVEKSVVLRVATVEPGPRRPSMCDGCSAPCCQGIFKPILSAEEFLSKKFKFALYPLPPSLKRQKIPADFVVGLMMEKDGRCPYFDKESHRCTIWPNCPKSCLAYDCREDFRPQIASFAQKRARQYLKKHFF